MNKNNTLIFDLDGTLTDTLGAAVAGSKEAVKTVTGRDVTDAEIKALFGSTETALFKHFIPDNWERGLEEYGKYFERIGGEDLLFPGIRAALDYLKECGVKMALVTGRGPLTTNIIIEKTDLKKYFDFVKTGSEFGSIKTQCMLEVLSAWGQNAGDSYYLGDIAHDVTDAQKAGVKPLSAAWAASADKHSQRAAGTLEIFDSAADFLAWLKK